MSTFRIPSPFHTTPYTEENQKLIVDFGGLVALCPLVRSSNAETVTAAVAAVRNLSIHRENAVRTLYTRITNSMQKYYIVLNVCSIWISFSETLCSRKTMFIFSNST